MIFKTNNTSFFRIFCLLMFLIFISLGFWQYKRFFYKKDNFLIKEKIYKDVINSQYQNINQEYISDIEKEIDQKNFIKKVRICEKIDKENFFIIYNFIEKKYKIIFLFKNNTKNSNINIFAEFNESFNSKENAESKILEIQKNNMIDFCLNGFLENLNNHIRSAKNFLQKIADFNGFNKKNNIIIDSNKNIIFLDSFNSKNLSYIIGQEKNSINLIVSQNINEPIKNYNHHLLYMTMWLFLSLYSLFLLIRYK
jgi:hypothetical protein